MTDLVSAPNTGAQDIVADGAAPTVPLTDALPPSDGASHVEWAPSQPAPKKRHIGLWIGIGAGALLLAAAGASTILIAPGTTVAGIPVGGMTAGMAADAISSHLADTEIVLSGAGSDVTVNGASLGVDTDAKALADAAFAAHPMWNLGSWAGEPIEAEITLDPDAAERSLRAAVPASYKDGVDAVVAFDAKSGTYTVTPAVEGTGIDLDALTEVFVAAVAEGKSSAEFTATGTPVAADITSDEADAAAAKLNEMLPTIGFYVGKERTVPVAPALAASWLSVTPVDGDLVIEADAGAIQSTVATLPKAVDRAAVNATTVVDSNGKVLRTLTDGQTGRALGSTAGIAAAFAAQLGQGNGTYALTVNETPFATTALERHAVVDLSQQHAYFYENGKLVRDWAVSTGRPGFETRQGNFRIRAHVAMQDMVGETYVTKDVKWVTYFNGNQAFHGTYWHNNFGNVMSHGCVNMPESAAKWVYDWAPDGFEVTVRQ
ncbi:murein L,D-transpeptidase [Microbacterium bovistercoris]|uniref:Murein L,D-transpeptidase n=1 Tax=Microbacterium bovistercoris TaxID=2293570 RepID=A0A371NT28_9MICO|nr:L,D-transpeptidase family protein [Microbacterium bovistercoris]REJ05270.1 murein L,D-transpeptidase [Microbacterium bovistercoris]